MRVLLLGEYSGLHTNLAAGLRTLGHDVKVVSSGDGFKNISGDIKLPLLGGDCVFSKLKYRADLFYFLKKFAGFDVVQLIGPSVFPATFFPYRAVLESLKSKNKSVFLVAAGCNYFYWTKGRASLRYGPFEDELNIDLGGQDTPHLSRANVERDTFVANAVDGIIPTAYEYAISHTGLKNLRTGIPLPLDLSQIKPVSSNSDQIRIFHGLSRPGFKGTHHIQSAFKLVEKRCAATVDCIIGRPIQLADYLKLLASVDLVVDQVNSYSYGMNALYAMALGKVVFSGAEPEAKRFLGANSVPVINVLPDAEQIAQSLLRVIECRSSISRLAKTSREFVECFHDSRVVADRFVNEWGRLKN